MAFSPHLKIKSTRNKGAIAHLKEETSTLVPTNEKHSDGLESKGKNAGSGEFAEYYDIYDEDIHNREDGQSGSG